MNTNGSLTQTGTADYALAAQLLTRGKGFTMMARCGVLAPAHRVRALLGFAKLTQKGVTDEPA